MNKNIGRLILFMAAVSVIIMLPVMYVIAKQKLNTDLSTDTASRVEALCQNSPKCFLYDKVGYKKYLKISNVFEAESRWNVNAYNSKTKDSGVAQINIPTWDDTAKKLGLGDYQTNWKSNITLALWIMDNTKKGIGNWDSSYSRHKINYL